MNGTIEINESSVVIRDKYGREVVSWTVDEFVEDDGFAAIAACNAIKVFYTEGVSEVARRVGKDISRPDVVVLTNNAGKQITYHTEELI